MRRLKNIGLCIAALLLVSSCSNITEHCDKAEVQGVQLQLSLDGLSAESRAMATESDETYIGTVQLFIFPVTADKSGVAERIVTLGSDKGTSDDMLNTWNSATGTLTLHGVTGSKIVYVVGNGTAANGYATATFAAGTTTQADLDNIVTKRNGNIVTPVAGKSGLLMVGSAEINFTTAKTATIPLVRQVAKIKLHVTFDKTFSDSYPVTKFGEATISPATVTAYNVPTHSYIVGTHTPALPAASLLRDYKAIDFSHIGAETAREWETEVYVYENPQTGVSDADKKLATQFVISIPYTDGTTATVYANSYLVYVNDPAIAAAASPHKTLRNTQYKVNVTVKGFGSAVPEVDRTTVTTEVLPWNVANSEQSVGDFLTVDKTVVNLVCEAPQSFVIKVNDVAKTQINNTNGANDKFEITSSAENGTITVNLLASDMTTSDITPNYDTFTIKQGIFTKSVTVNYRPHPLYLLAKGDLDAGINTSGEQVLYINDVGVSGMMFRGGSVIGIAVTMGGTPTFSQRIWFQPKTRTYAEIGNNQTLVPPVVNTDAEYNLFPNNHPNPYYRQGFLHTPTAESVKAGIGDPCRLIGQTQAQIAAGVFNNTWRLPRAGEIDLLWGNSNIVTSATATGAYIGIRGVNERIAFFSFYPKSIYLIGGAETVDVARSFYLTTGTFAPHIHAIEAASTPEPTCGNSYLHQAGLGGAGSLAMLYRIRCIRQ